MEQVLNYQLEADVKNSVLFLKLLKVCFLVTFKRKVTKTAANMTIIIDQQNQRQGCQLFFIKPAFVIQS